MNKHLTYDEFYDCCQNYEMIYQNYFEQTKEIDRLNNRIYALEKHNKKLELEAQKYFDLLMECKHGGDKNE